MTVTEDWLPAVASGVHEHGNEGGEGNLGGQGVLKIGDAWLR